jgi:hemin uptake protein HemP
MMGVETSDQQANHERPITERVSAAACRTLDAAALFGDAREVRLRHGDQEYRLRVTRQGKLILTK